MSYKTLSVGERWLKNLPAVVADAQNGVTADDVSAAESMADAEINAFFSKYYNIEDWADSTPPYVASIADMIGSARLLMLKFSADAQAGTVEMASWLEGEARRMMESVKHSGLLDSAGDLLLGNDTTQARGVPRMENPSE